jgi:hypothetical protein
MWGKVPVLFPTEDVDLIWTALRKGPLVFKLTHSENTPWAVSAYDVANDPGEEHDRFDPNDPAHRAAAAELAAYKARLVDAYPGERERLLPASEERSRLRSLGYIQ